MPGLHARGYAVAFLFTALGALWPLARLLVARTRRPSAVWAAVGYIALLHGICLYGLATSPLFSNALPQLSLFTFPFSALVGDTHMNEGFAALPDLAANYVRYVLCFGGLNAGLIAGFLLLVMPAQAPGQPSANAR